MSDPFAFAARIPMTAASFAEFLRSAALTMGSFEDWPAWAEGFQGEGGALKLPGTVRGDVSVARRLAELARSSALLVEQDDDGVVSVHALLYKPDPEQIYEWLAILRGAGAFLGADATAVGVWWSEWSGLLPRPIEVLGALVIRRDGSGSVSERGLREHAELRGLLELLRPAEQRFLACYGREDVVDLPLAPAIAAAARVSAP